MTRVEDTPEIRVRRLVQAARRIADSDDPLGRRARELLPGTTGLSREGVEYALAHCLEIEPTEAEIQALCESTPSAPRAHVLLSANVFVAVHRAVAVALASSPSVEVRASRREPMTARLLCEASSGLFRLVDELAPLPADRVWAYGRDPTLSAIRGDLPSGVVLHAHGEGMGVVVVQVAGADEETASAMRNLAGSLAYDVVAFDQRGCLSPRVVFVLGSPSATRMLASCLSRELTALEHEIPRGAMEDEELGDQTWYRDTMTYCCELFPAGKGAVSCDVEEARVIIPPVGRNLHVVRVESLARVLPPLAASVAAVGVAGPDETWESVRELLPRCRVSPIGKMQTPRFDGPVDRRPDPNGEVL